MGSKMFPRLERKNGGVLAEKGTQERQNAIQDVVRTSDLVSESHVKFSGYKEITRPARALVDDSDIGK